MAKKFAAWRRAKAACMKLGRNDRRTLRVLSGFSVLAMIYLGVIAPVSARLAAAEVRFEQARQLNLELIRTLSSVSVSSTTLSADLLRQELSQDRTLVGIELLNLSRQGRGTQSHLSGPAEPLLRWLASLEARGARVTQLRLIS
ncbi:type II secretion system protein GspM, partial [Pseudomonas fluorescens]